MRQGMFEIYLVMKLKFRDKALNLLYLFMFPYKEIKYFV